MDTPDQINYKGLPPREAFSSKVRLIGIRDEDHKNTQRMCETFKCKDYGDDRWVDLKTEVLLLADMFDNIRTMSV